VSQRVSQLPYATTLIADTRALDARAGEIERTADPAGLRWNPPDGGWSAGQAFEHLCVSNDDYLKVLRPLVARLPAVPDGDASGLTWRPSLAGGFLARSMQSPRKLPTPKAWKPVAEPGDGVIAAFLARQREIVELIERSMAHEWTRLRLGSPVSPLIRMNIGDAFTILVRHAERHFRQIDERLAAFEAVRRDRVAVQG
jgi:hypothetical protein